MRQRVLADSGPLYAAADRDDQYHNRAQQDLQRLLDDDGADIVPMTTVLEAYTLILRRLGTRQALGWLADLPSVVSIIEPVSNDYARAIARLQHYPDQRLTLFDAVLAAMSDRIGAPVWSYDYHFDVMQVAVWR